MVGIVILNYNSWADTVACVDSIHEAEKKLEFRIYLVDNCSPVRPEPGVLESLDKRGVIFIQNERNAGYSAGNNIGIKRALEDGCEEVLISNSDVRYETGSISELQTYLQDHPDVGIVGPKIFLRDGSIQKECMMRKTYEHVKKRAIDTNNYFCCFNAYCRIFAVVY